MLNMTVYVTEDASPIAGTNITMSSDQGGTFSITTGTTDSNGNFTFTFNTQETATQVEVTITAAVTKSGYQNSQGQTKIVVNPTPSSTPSVEGLPLTTILLIAIPIAAVAIVAILIKAKVIIITRE